MADAGSPGSASPGARADPQPSIAEVQARILEQLQASRAVLTARSSGGSLPKDELAEVLEELSHSTALLATVKRDLDAMFSRLRRTRSALAAAFPQHAVAPRRVVPHEDEEEGAAAGRRQRREQEQPAAHEGQPATGDDEQPLPPPPQQQQQQQQQLQPKAGQHGVQAPEPGSEAAAGEGVARRTAAAQQLGSQQPELQQDAAGQEQDPDAQAEQQAEEASGGEAASSAAADAPPDAPHSS